MINSTYNPIKQSDFEKGKLNFYGIGQSFVATAGTETSNDMLIADDYLVTGGVLVIEGAVWGDFMDLKIVDKDGIMSPAGTVLNTFIYDWIIPTGNSQLPISIPYPAKIYGGLYVRIIYDSVGTTNVNVGVNYNLHRVLV